MERIPVTNVEHLFNQIGFDLKSIVAILCLFKIKGKKKLVTKIELYFQLATEYKKSQSIPLELILSSPFKTLKYYERLWSDL